MFEWIFVDWRAYTCVARDCWTRMLRRVLEILISCQFVYPFLFELLRFFHSSTIEYELLISFQWNNSVLYVLSAYQQKSI